jgi:hypothetical protein
VEACDVTVVAAHSGQILFESRHVPKASVAVAVLTKANGSIHEALTGAKEHLARRANALTTGLGQADFALASVMERPSSPNPSERFERSEHTTDDRSRDAQRAAQIALSSRPADPQSIAPRQREHQVKSGSGYPQRRERLARHAQDAVKGTFAGKEDRVHRARSLKAFLVPTGAPPSTTLWHLGSR